METLFVLAIVGAALVFAVLRIARRFAPPPDDCRTRCSGCAGSCGERRR